MTGKVTKKDRWDKVSIIASVLIPISVALVGTYYSWSMKQAEISVTKSNLEIEKIKSLVAQANLVHTFMKSLASTDLNERKIAISAVLLALPKEGERLVESIYRSDQSEDVRRFAGSQLGIILLNNIEYKLMGCIHVKENVTCTLYITSPDSDRKILVKQFRATLFDDEGRIFFDGTFRSLNKKFEGKSTLVNLISGVPSAFEIEFRSGIKMPIPTDEELTLHVNNRSITFRNIVFSY